jgi:hypothetical protein
VDFDATPPTVSVSKATARKLKRPSRTYLVRVALALGDAGGSSVSYKVTLVDPHNLNEVAKAGNTSAGAASAAVRIRLTKRTRSLKIEVEASDPGG